MVCTDYDLCDKCHTAGIHDEHPMLKIEHPKDNLEVQSTVGRLAPVLETVFDKV